MKAENGKNVLRKIDWQFFVVFFALFLTCLVVSHVKRASLIFLYVEMDGTNKRI